MLVAQAATPEVTFWESVRDSEDPDEIEAYLKAYPNGEFAPLARIRLDKLKRAPKEAAPGAVLSRLVRKVQKLLPSARAGIPSP